MLRILWAAALMLLFLGRDAAAIVGGEEKSGVLARTVVMVLSSKGGVCSALLVAPDVVLTAAHCVAHADEHRVHFRAADGSAVLIPPVAKVVHPGFDPKAIQGRRRSIDLALVRTPEPLPGRFQAAVLSSGKPARDSSLLVGGYGVARERDHRSTGTFRTASLRAIEPFGPSSILIWAEGDPKGSATGACEGDSGGPLAQDETAVLGITTWAAGAKGRACGALTQGILVGPQRAWIDETLAMWGRAATWRP